MLVPSEPQASCLAAKVKHTAYHNEEAGGFVWVYMGEAEPPAAAFSRRASSSFIFRVARVGIDNTSSRSLPTPCG